MFSPNNYMRDGHSRASNLFGQVNRSRYVIPVLGLLNVMLLMTAVVLGIYCSKNKEGYLQPLEGSEHVTDILEFNFLRANQSNVIKATQEAEEALKLEVAKHDEIKQQSEKQKGINDGFQSQMDRGRTEKRKLMADKLRMGTSCGHCPDGWMLLNSSCYLFSNFLTEQPSKKSWVDSRQDCINRKADLVIIDNWDEQQLLNDNLPKIPSHSWWTEGFWIGLTDVVATHRWVWINNVTQQIPMYWWPGEPNMDNENCVLMAPSADASRSWGDALCQDRHYLNWICEMKQNEQ